jgi:hypothetical protein
MLTNFIPPFFHTAHQRVNHYAAPQGAEPARWFASQRQLAERLVTSTATLLPTSPTFDSSWVKDHSFDDWQANCVSYAYRLKQYRWMPLGMLAQVLRTDEPAKALSMCGRPRTADDVRALLERDGLAPLEGLADIIAGDTLTSAFVDDTGRYHFKRLDIDGGVSHVEGQHDTTRTAGPEQRVKDRVKDLLSYRSSDDGRHFRFIGLWLVNHQRMLSSDPLPVNSGSYTELALSRS